MKLKTLRNTLIVFSLIIIFSNVLLSMNNRSDCELVDFDKGKFHELIALEKYYEALKFLQSEVSPTDYKVLDNDCKTWYDSKITYVIKKINEFSEQYGMPYHLSNFYYTFYENILLSYNNGLYYYSDSSGRKIELLGEWDFALPFNLDGHVLVEKVNNNTRNQILIDVNGNQYPIAESISQITSETKGLVFSHFPEIEIKDHPKLHQIEILILDNIKLKEIPASISNFENLKYLSLANCKLDSFILKEKGLNNLTHLNLNNNNLTSIPNDLINFKKLIFLDLSNNKLTQLPSEIGDLGSLEVLILNSESMYAENITNLSENFGDLGRLRILQCNGNKIGQSVSQLSNLEHLEVLTLKYCKIDSNFIDFGKFEKLRVLDLSNNNLKRPPQFKGLITNNLECLILDRNNIVGIPSEFYELDSLKFLSLRNNKLSIVSDSIGYLNKLISLNLANNNVTTLPRGIINLKLLKYLNIAGNNLNYFPNELCQLSNLRTLDLEKTNISDIPECITTLQNLKVLYIHGNELQVIPKNIFNIIGLESLFLSNNPIRSLSPKVLQLQNLQLLSCSQCNLETIPEELLQMDNLVVLILAGNKIQKFPDNLRKMKKLKMLEISYNKISAEEKKRIEGIILQ